MIILKRMIYEKEEIITSPNNDETLLDSIPESVPDIIRVHQANKGNPDLDDMLYRHVKQMVCDHTTYVLCTHASDDCTDVSK